ncbi:GNAT family N-acetyltransferase [Salinisphaera sp. Q1T1-3]|uniref:GNAT family N-acetyltransferase n=1 Tax=Salinisphaera sp. Q1T1-3 TaxID=2321229 RepID=UPI001314F3E6|nr:GNAT family N-acetyltransferase [Salinisphaera sp. Q1T1-3]
MKPAIAALEGWDEALRFADFEQLSRRVPSYVIQADGRDCGYLQVLPRADVLHVVNVAFGPASRGAGHGARLFDWLRGAARRRRCGLHLKTYRSNPRALAFYQREGFVIRCIDARHWWLDWSRQ